MLDALSDGWRAVARWWDGVELWLTQLPLPAQVALLMLVLLPLCWGVATLIDRAVEAVSARVGHGDVGHGDVGHGDDSRDDSREDRR